MGLTLFILILLATGFCLFVFLGLVLAGKEKQQFNMSVKVSVNGNREFPTITMQVDLLGIEITT